MKKICMYFLLICLLVGCSQQGVINEKPEETTTYTSNVVTTTSIQTTKPETTTTIITTLEGVTYPSYHMQIMSGDFTAIAGDYINGSGEIFSLNNQGLKENEESDGTVYYVNDVYQMGIHKKGDIEGGYMITIYPAGVEITIPTGEDKLILNTDSSKIRIYYGQDYPSSAEQIYYKKEE